MNTIFKFRERALKRLENKDLSIDSWIDDIVSVGVYLEYYLRSKNYSYEEFKKNEVFLYKEADEVRLRQAQERLDTIKENKKQGLIQSVNYLKSRFDEFLEFYNIGYAREFYLKGNNIYIRISLAISKSCGMGNEQATKERILKKQLDILKGLKLELTKQGCNRYKINASDENKKILDSLFELFEAKVWSYNIWNNHFENVVLYIRPEKILSADIPGLLFEKSNELKLEDDIQFIKKSLDELMHALSTIEKMPSMIDTCGYIVEHSFADICKTLDIATSLREEVENRHKDIRKINAKIRELEQNVGKVLTGKEISNLGEKYLLEIGWKVLNKIGFDLSNESKITQYNAWLKFENRSTCSIYLGLENYRRQMNLDENVVDELENLEEKIISSLDGKFDMIQPFPNEKYIAYTNKNIKTIMEWVKNNFYQQIDGFEVDSKNNMLYIKSFYLTLDKIK